jgi:hypothetical protein
MELIAGFLSCVISPADGVGAEELKLAALITKHCQSVPESYRFRMPNNNSLTIDELNRERCEWHSAAKRPQHSIKGIGRHDAAWLLMERISTT